MLPGNSRSPVMARRPPRRKAGAIRLPGLPCSRSSVAESLPPVQEMRVRFPPAALDDERRKMNFEDALTCLRDWEEVQ